MRRLGVVNKSTPPGLRTRWISFKKSQIILQVFDDLKGDHRVKLVGIDASQRGKGGLHNAGLGWNMQIGHGVFVNAQVLVAMLGQESHPVTFPAAQFQDRTFHIGYGGQVGSHVPLVDWVLGGILCG